MTEKCGVLLCHRSWMLFMCIILILYLNFIVFFLIKWTRIQPSVRQQHFTMEVRGMLEISVIKIEDPGCLWGRIVRGPGKQAVSPCEYEDLQTKMNLFYHEVNLDVEKIKPTTLEEGQLCVVFHPALRSWCRATVESLFKGTLGKQALCFLVDHGERIIVSTDNVRAPLDKFLQLPFRVRRFGLARIHPLRLEVSICNETAELVPSRHWDTSATKYLHNLLQVSTLAEAVLCEINAGCTAVELYLTIGNVKICVNDDLVVKKFACFSSEKAIMEEQRGSVDRSPVSLAWDIFSSPQQIKMNGYCTMRSSPSHVLTRKGQLRLSPHDETHVTPFAKSPVSAVKPPDTNGEKYSGETEEFNKGSVTSGVRGKYRSVKSSEKETQNTGNFNQTENTDSTLAKQLSQKLNLNRQKKFHNPFSYSNWITKPDEYDEQNQATDKPGPRENDLTYYREQESAVCEQSGSDLSGTGNTSTELKETTFTQESDSKDQLACARLLQFLNPDPINSDSECIDDNVVCFEPSRSGVLVHSPFPISPCKSLTHAPITEQFRKFLLRSKYSEPCFTESYCWPPVARGCDTVLVCPSENNHLYYIPPLLVHLQLAPLFSAFTKRTGPIAVILCPGWEKVQFVIGFLEESQAAAKLHAAAVQLGLGKDEAKKTKIQNNCQLLVTTPFSLVRLLEVHHFLFLRLCYLVLHEASELYSRAPDQMAAILQHFQKVVSREERDRCPRQIVAVSRHWSRELEDMVREYMVSPCVIITVPEEAATYGGVHQTILLCLDCDKTSVLLSSLDFSPSVPQKTLIFTNTAEEVEHVYKAISNTAAFSLKAHEGLTDHFEFVVEQWKKDIGPGTQVILVTTNDCMKALGIRDATCVVHYGFPISPKLFGNRLFSMSENFKNLSNKDCPESASPVRSVLLLSEHNARHVSGVLRYLKRTGALLPPELLQFAEGVHQAKEEQKLNKALCSHLKSLGFCRDRTLCPERHTINKALDYPLHPDSGTIVVLPLYIRSANVYYGRIVNQKEDHYKTFAAKLNSHYAKERLCAKEVVEGGMYTVQEEGVYHRVSVIKVPEKQDQLFSRVTVDFIDEGRVQEVKSHQLLQLPPEFQSLPGQAVEIILCGVQPIDGDMDWNPRVTRAISLKIKEKIHQAKVVMCMGNTVWVDQMVHMTRVPGLKTFINEYNVHAEIIATGMGTTNPRHLELLKLLCPGEEVFTAVHLSESSRCERETLPLEQRVLAPEKALAGKMKAGIPSLSREGEPCEPSEKLKEPNQITVSNGGSSKASSVDDEQMLKSTNQRCLPQIVTETISDSSYKEPTNDMKIKNGVLHAESVHIVPQSFHPQIKWFQGEESVTLKVKLVNPVMQKCEFFSDRVIYSAYVSNQFYCANMELHGDIITEQCLWEMKYNEPVIHLVKKEKGEWKSLLKQKSALISYDFDHIKDEDIPASDGRWFLANTGEEGSYITSESGSESD